MGVLLLRRLHQPTVYYHDDDIGGNDEHDEHDSHGDHGDRDGHDDHDWCEGKGQGNPLFEFSLSPTLQFHNKIPTTLSMQLLGTRLVHASHSTNKQT